MTIVAIKKPLPQQFVRWDSALATLPVNAEIHHVETGVFEVWNRLRKQWLRFSTGDYLNITRPEDIYPVDKRDFAAHYDVQQPERSPIQEHYARG